MDTQNWPENTNASPNPIYPEAPHLFVVLNQQQQSD